MKTLERPPISAILKRAPKKRTLLDKIQDALGALLCVGFAAIAGLLLITGNLNLALPWIGLSVSVCPWVKINPWIRFLLGAFCFFQT